MAGSSHTTVTSLLSRVRDAGNHQAWQEFDERYRELILRYARRKGLQASDAEDVRQLVMMKLMKTLPNFTYDKERGRFRDYLGSVTRTVIFDWRARPNPARLAVDTTMMATVPAEDESAADAQWEQEWLDHHYRLAMKTVRASFEPRSVEAFDRILAGETIEAIAAAFDLSTQAVHKIKQRIRDRVQELIANQIREEDALEG